MEKLIEMLKEQYAYENIKLAQYGHECSVGKCAQSRIHLLDNIFAIIKEQNLTTPLPVKTNDSKGADIS